MSEVVFTRSAQTDLLAIWTFISDDRFEAADRVLDVIEKEIQTLILQPLMVRERPELHPDVRCWPTSASYNLYYTVENVRLTVFRVLQQERDVNSRLF